MSPKMGCPDRKSSKKGYCDRKLPPKRDALMRNPLKKDAPHREVGLRAQVSNKGSTQHLHGFKNKTVAGKSTE